MQLKGGGVDGWKSTENNGKAVTICLMANGGFSPFTDSLQNLFLNKFVSQPGFPESRVGDEDLPVGYSSGKQFQGVDTGEKIGKQILEQNVELTIAAGSDVLSYQDLPRAF